MALTFWGKTFSPVCDAMPSSDAMPRLDAPEVSAGGGCQFPPLMMGRGGRLVICWFLFGQNRKS